jgi:hypothetical protein
MGGRLSRCPKRDDACQQSKCTGPPVVLPDRGCAWKSVLTDQERSCFKELYPMFTTVKGVDGHLRTGPLKTDTTRKPSILQRLAFWRIIKMMVPLLLLDFLLFEVQARNNVLKPFDSTALNLIFVGSGFFVAGVISTNLARAKASAAAAAAFWNANTSLAQHLVANIRPSMLSQFDMEVRGIERYDPDQCIVTPVTVTAREILKEVGHIVKTNPYALTNDNRTAGVKIERLPFTQELKGELTVFVSKANMSFMEGLGTMLETRVMILVENGFMIESSSEAMRNQIDGLNNALGAVFVAKIKPAVHVNFFLAILQFVWSVFVIWRLSTFSRTAAVLMAFGVQYASYALVALAKAGSNPFENLETNPLSPIPLQDLQHSSSLQALMMIMNSLLRIDAYNSSKNNNTDNTDEQLMSVGGKHQRRRADVQRVATLRYEDTPRGGHAFGGEVY